MELLLAPESRNTLVRTKDRNFNFYHISGLDWIMPIRYKVGIHTFSVMKESINVDSWNRHKVLKGFLWKWYIPTLLDFHTQKLKKASLSPISYDITLIALTMVSMMQARTTQGTLNMVGPNKGSELLYHRNLTVYCL